MYSVLNDFYLKLKYAICFFVNDHVHNVISTLLNVVKLDVENENVVLTLPNVAHKSVIDKADSKLLNAVNSTVDIHNVVSTLI